MFLGLWRVGRGVHGLFGVGQLGEQVCSRIALLRYVVYLKTFEVVNEIFGNVVVLEQRCFLGLVFVDNFPLHKLRGSVTL